MLDRIGARVAGQLGTETFAVAQAPRELSEAARPYARLRPGEA
jgi:hypothetical protein